MRLGMTFGVGATVRPLRLLAYSLSDRLFTGALKALLAGTKEWVSTSPGCLPVFARGERVFVSPKRQRGMSAPPRWRFGLTKTNLGKNGNAPSMQPLVDSDTNIRETGAAHRLRLYRLTKETTPCKRCGRQYWTALTGRFHTLRL